MVKEAIYHVTDHDNNGVLMFKQSDSPFDDMRKLSISNFPKNVSNVRDWKEAVLVAVAERKEVVDIFIAKEFQFGSVTLRKMEDYKDFGADKMVEVMGAKLVLSKLVHPKVQVPGDILIEGFKKMEEDIVRSMIGDDVGLFYHFQTYQMFYKWWQWLAWSIM